MDVYLNEVLAEREQQDLKEVMKFIWLAQDLELISPFSGSGTYQQYV
jgi:hypothetical protein